MRWRGSTQRIGLYSDPHPIYHGVALPIAEQILPADRLPDPKVCDHDHKHQDTALECGRKLAKAAEHG